MIRIFTNFNKEAKKKTHTHFRHNDWFNKETRENKHSFKQEGKKQQNTLMHCFNRDLERE